MPKKKLTDKEQAVRDLKRAQPDMSIGDLAAVLEVQPITVENYLYRLRAAGELPASNGRRKAPEPRPAQGQAEHDRQIAQAPAMLPTLEDHVEEEYGAVTHRLEEIEQRVDELQEEQRRLLGRKQRLSQAKGALAGEYEQDHGMDHAVSPALQVAN